MKILAEGQASAVVRRSLCANPNWTGGARLHKQEWQNPFKIDASGKRFTG